MNPDGIMELGIMNPDRIMNPEKLLESIRELVYDLERAQNDDEINDLLSNFVAVYPQRPLRDWEKIDPQFKPGILANELIRQWVNREQK